MDIKEFIDDAFKNYEETPELLDFKEELLTNLEDRIKNLEAKGMKRRDALKVLEIEFSDINNIADEMSLEKKKEVFEYRYMSLRNFVSKQRAAIYTILGVLAAMGLASAGIHYYSTGTIDTFTSLWLILSALPLSGFVYMGLTQETASRYPLKPLRASIYTIASFVLLVGVLLVPIMVFGETIPIKTTLVMLIPFAIPSIGIIAFLIITESDYYKPWVKKEIEKQIEKSRSFENSKYSETFGIMTGAVWILAISACVLLLILKLWIFSWIPFVVAIVLTLVLLAFYMNK